MNRSVINVGVNIKYLAYFCGYTETLNREKLLSKVCTEVEHEYGEVDVIYIDTIYDNMNEIERSLIIPDSDRSDDKLWGLVMFKFTPKTEYLYNIYTINQINALMKDMEFCYIPDSFCKFQLIQLDDCQYIQVSVDSEHG